MDATVVHYKESEKLQEKSRNLLVFDVYLSTCEIETMSTTMGQLFQVLYFPLYFRRDYFNLKSIFVKSLKIQSC